MATLEGYEEYDDADPVASVAANVARLEGELSGVEGTAGAALTKATHAYTELEYLKMRVGTLERLVEKLQKMIGPLNRKS